MKEVSGRRLSITVLISLAAHATLAVVVVLSPAFLPQLQRALPNVELTLEIHTPPDEVVVTPPPPPDEVRAPNIVRGARSPERAITRAVTREPGMAILPDALVHDPLPSEPEASELPRETEEERRARLRLLLDPAAVARGVFVIDEPSPASSGGRGHAARRSAAQIGAELSESLRRSAMTKAYAGRRTPELRAGRDGALVYAGQAFSATIRRDGTVQFDDRPNLRLNGISTSGTFDITDSVMRANGADPYSAERAWFMRETEALRDQLADADRAQTVIVGMRRLRGRLARVWEDESLSPEQRRRAIFGEWTDVDDADSRTLVEQFVRDNLPSGGADAFSIDELRRLNAHLGGGARFAPYR